MNPTSEIIQWYRVNGRDLPWRNTRDPYLIYLSEVILQQTQVKQGLPYYEAFAETYPDIRALATASEEEVLKLWQGLGYYSRARNLHQTAKYICEELNGEFPHSYDQIIQLKGVGPYTAAAISSFAFNEPYPVLDGNVERVISRYFGIADNIRKSPGKQHLQQSLQAIFQKDSPALFNQAIMEFGSQMCAPKPKCSECPLSQSCYANLNAMHAQIPNKGSKIKTKEIYLNYFFSEQNGRVLVEQKTEGIWSKLYQFPLVEGNLDAKEMAESLKKIIRFDPGSEVKKTYSCTHLLSHRKINAHFYTITSPLPVKPLKSHIFEIDLEELRSKYPTSVLMVKFLEQL